MHSGYVVCQICESYHGSFEELNTHYESDHPTGRREANESGIQPNEDGRFPCEFCDKSFTRKDYMYGHQRKVHGRESVKAKKADYQGNFPCEVCGNKLSSTQKLKHHMKVKHNIQE